jgi:hypothetical protein
MKKITIYFQGEWDMMPLIQKIELPNGELATDRDVEDLQSLMFEGKALRDFQGIKTSQDFQTDLTP